jgi:septum formation protein
MLHINKTIILASASPRRAKLLKQINIPFVTKISSVEEINNGLEPVEFARDMSALKARDIAGSIGNGLIIAADTIVVLDGVILGKPKNDADAIKMLKLLSGRVHEVITGFTILDKPSDYIQTDHESTRVRFRELSDDEIRSYVDTGSPLDKAGAYGIQDDYGAVFVDRIEGCYYNVVGLPLAKLYRSLMQAVSSIY